MKLGQMDERVLVRAQGPKTRDSGKFLRSGIRKLKSPKSQGIVKEHKSETWTITGPEGSGLV